MSPAEAQAWMRRVSRTVEADAQAALRDVAPRWLGRVKSETPRDTGALARRWRYVRGPAGLVLRNDRPRARYALRGGAVDLALRIVRAGVHRDARLVARDLKRRILARAR